MGFTIGGLSTGMDTNTIIDKLMEIERQPIVRLEAKKTEQNQRLTAFTTFNTKLGALLNKVDRLETSRDLIARSVTASAEDMLSATAGSTAVPGSYEVKVLSLAQVEKQVYLGVADKNTTTFGTGTLSINNAALSSPVSIDIDSSNNTLEGLRDAINTKSTEHGVTASIVNDGSGTPYRLVLSGASVENAGITLDASGLGAGASLPGIDAAVSRSANQARVTVDGILIVGNTNTLTEAVPGLTLDLKSTDVTPPLGANPSPAELDAAKAGAKVTTLAVKTDEEGIKTRITDFVSAFNDLVKASKDDALASDSGVRAILGSFRGMLTSSSGGTGLFQLGIFTQKDGTLEVNSDKLATAVKENLSGIESLLVGSAGIDGVAVKLKASLTTLGNTNSGFLAGRKNSIDSTIRRLEKEIVRNESLMEYREKRLIAQFSGLEELVGNLNSVGAYLTQQFKQNSK
jgi:flagellar hook-associated protein 2